ncbi:MAG: efflux RND transporter periplasmic adaptor subunit [Candidatus Uhrbacteria bacterium]|nr:efflux RND transporter periplasmic adaptor subunit [Candidatus Uhrbacteria bacterium]
MMKKILSALLAHKIRSGIALVILLLGGFWFYQNYTKSHQPIKYVLAQATKGTIVTSISGSGQISASNQFDIKSKASGDVVNVKATEGQLIKTGDLILQLDAKDAQKSVRDALANLESAKISLAKLTQAPTQTESTQAQNAVTNAQATLDKLTRSQPIDEQNAADAETKASDALDKAYSDAFNSMANTFLDFPDAATLANSTLTGTDLSGNVSGQTNLDYLKGQIRTEDWQDLDKLNTLLTRASTAYTSAKYAYDTAFLQYKITNRTSDTSAIETLLTQTLTAAQALSDTLKDENNAVTFIIQYRTDHTLNIASNIKTAQTNLGTQTAKMSGDLSSLLSTKQSIEDDKDTLTRAKQAVETLIKNDPLDLANAQANLKDKQNTLNDLKTGPQTLDIQSSQLSVTEKQNALQDAQEKLADSTIRAPFDGTLAKISVKKGDSVSSGTAVATLVTAQQIAEVSLNEVDVSKIALKDKATLTFDAISDLQMTGSVASIDTIGTVSQGVVTYNVKIAFDTQDDRIKSGMSVSAAIITNTKTDILTVPNAAVKTTANGSYVQMLSTIPAGTDTTSLSGIASATPPSQVPVQIGISNDSVTEIMSGINEGDNVVVRSIDPNAKTTASQGTSLFQATGATGGRGGAAGGAAAGGARRTGG